MAPACGLHEVEGEEGVTWIEEGGEALLQILDTSYYVMLYYRMGRCYIIGRGGGGELFAWIEGRAPTVPAVKLTARRHITPASLSPGLLPCLRGRSDPVDTVHAYRTSDTLSPPDKKAGPRPRAAGASRPACKKNLP